jgi:hypothetical protein
MILKNSITMHPKRLFWALMISLLPFISTAQVDKEISSFVDSTEHIVNKGRILLAKHLANNQYKKAQEVYDYLEQTTNKNPFAAFTYHEAIYINIATKNWDKVSEMMLNYGDLYRKDVYYFEYNIQGPVYDHIKKNIAEINSSYRKAAIDQEAKALLKLLFYYLEQEEANVYYTQTLKHFKNDYHDSKYLMFANNFLPSPIYKVGVGINLGSGAMVPTSKFAKNYKATACFNMGFDFNINKVYTSLYFDVGGPKLKVPFMGASETHDIDFIENETFIYFNGGLKVGYFLLRNKHLHIAGYGNIGYSRLSSNRFESSGEEEAVAKEYKVFSSFSSGAGLHTEIKLMEFGEPSYYMDSSGYLSLKIDLGYNIIFNFNDDKFKGNAQYISVGLAAGLGYF